MISESDLSFISLELGDVSSKKLTELVQSINNGKLIDIGIYEGASSRIMVGNSSENNNLIYAIDPVNPIYRSNHPNYFYLKEDSVQVGKNWDNGEVDLVFFDSVHAKEQVLCELYYWWDLIKENGYAVFHDTSWEGYIHKPGHPCEGKKTGNSGMGYDTYGGINWETPDKAIEEFFNIKLNTEQRDIEKNEILKVFEDDFILVETNYSLLGMTFITKKKTSNYKQNILNWSEIFDRRKILLSFFK